MRAKLPRRFALRRHRDPSGVSGTGIVAYGTVYPAGWVTLVWNGPTPTVNIFDRTDDVLRIHGHNGATTITWIDPPTTS